MNGLGTPTFTRRYSSRKTPTVRDLQDGIPDNKKNRRDIQHLEGNDISSRNHEPTNPRLERWKNFNRDSEQLKKYLEKSEIFKRNREHSKRNFEHSKKNLETRESFQAPPNILKKIGSFRASRRPVIVPSIRPTTMTVSTLPLRTRVMRSLYPAFLHLKMKVVKTLRLRQVQNYFTTYKPPVVAPSMYTEISRANYFIVKKIMQLLFQN